mgnify:CR=1 FL=1|tara:strand:- start:141 stop:329 length:189 start_codon:yes stop_codon:yes gene_type:complete
MTGIRKSNILVLELDQKLKDEIAKTSESGTTSDKAIKILKEHIDITTTHKKSGIEMLVDEFT